MRKRLTAYLAYLENALAAPPSDAEKAALKEDLLIQIGFFQHERLIHLLVTLSFALFTFIALGLAYAFTSLPFLILTFLLLILLVPYIRHYYFLENGTQKLYKYYDQLK